VGVVHLIRRANEVAIFKAFLDGYRRHPAGRQHELVLALKGFDDEAHVEPYRALASGLDVRWVSVPDEGFDLGAYGRAALALSHSRLLLLNSFSTILTDNWLELLDAACGAGVGAVAASGSWGSPASHLRYALGLGGPYSAVFPGREATERVFADLARDGREGVSSDGGALRRRAKLARTIVRQAVGFSPFPSPHLRTNGLLVDRDQWLRVCRGSFKDKLSAYLIESGRRGITARLESSKLRVLVVGRDGRAYVPTEWPESLTLWQGNQENLIIGDNQTRAYQAGDADTRRVLSAYAWGPQAAPAEPDLST
jgi:hypothetical protein